MTHSARAAFLLASLTIALCSPARAASGVSAQGTRGLQRVEAASGLGDGTFVLTLGGHFSSSSGLFAPGDENLYHGQGMVFAYGVLDWLDLSLAESVVSNRNASFEPATVQSVGDPVLGLKANTAAGPLRVGLSARVRLPTSAHGTGINAGGFVLTGLALASYAATPYLTVSANAGYQLDNSRKVFKRDLLAVQRFVAEVSNVDQIVAGLGAETRFSLSAQIEAGPFLEATGGLGQGVAKFSQNPLRVSGGFKLWPVGGQALELAVGGDFGLQGKPVADGKLPGIPPWELFARLAVAIGGSAGASGSGPRGAALSCGSDASCPSGLACLDGACGRLKEVVKEVRIAPPTFVIEGRVGDKAGDSAVGSAVVAISGVAGSPLAVDYKTGVFRSWPLPAGDGLVKVTVVAPGYRPAEQTLPRGKAGDVVQVAFALQSLGSAATGEIRGGLKDAQSGKPIATGQVFIPSVGQRIKPDPEGNFTAQVKAGRYQVLISAPRYVTQSKEIEIRAGDVVILNVDMTPKR